MLQRRTKARPPEGTKIAKEGKWVELCKKIDWRCLDTQCYAAGKGPIHSSKLKQGEGKAHLFP